MGNEATKQQIKNWLEESVRKAKNPDKKELIKKKRMLRAEKVKIRYGF